MVKRLRNSRGQLAVEMVLLLALLVAIIIAVSSTFREKEILASFVARPWKSIASMIQNGVWTPGKVHPTHSDRWVSIRGEDAE